MLWTTYKDEQDKILDLENLKSSTRGKYRDTLHVNKVSVVRDMIKVLWKYC